MAKPSEVLRKTKNKDKDDKKSKGNAMMHWIAEKKKGGDIGKHNNGTTTGFKAVEKKAAKEYHSEEAGEKVAGAIYQKMKGK